MGKPVKPPSNRRVSTTLPWGCDDIVEQMVGTIYGPTKASVLRFIIIHWMHNNPDVQRAIREDLNKKKK